LKHPLQGASKRVEVQLLPRVRGYFYVRSDPTPDELKLDKQLPEIINQHLGDFQ